MNPIVSLRACSRYDLDEILRNLRQIYSAARGPSLAGKTVLVKPNILTDNLPERAISTHPLFVEAVIYFLREQGAARIIVGDAPAIHNARFQPLKSGIYDVCTRSGAEWQYFAENPRAHRIGNHSVKIASAAFEADLIVSLPKLKTHGLMLFTGAIKNTFGLLPGYHKAKQHAYFNTQEKFARFLLDLNQHIPVHFAFMDAITAMEGPGPSNGFPIQTGLILGSADLLALDIIASRICGYEPLDVPTNLMGLGQHPTLRNPGDILCDGPDPSIFIQPGFRKIQHHGVRNMTVRFLLNRFPFLKKLEPRPIFFEDRCIACRACIKICPAQVLTQDNLNPRRILIRDRDCIRCFCCHEVCPQNAIEIKRKLI